MHVGQEPFQVPDKQVSVAVPGPVSQLYIRVLFGVVSVFPVISVAFAHNGALPQLPRRSQVGQAPIQELDKQMNAPVAGMKLEVQEYIRVLF